MEALIDIEIATTLLKEDGTEGAEDSPVDTNYKKLKTELKPVDQDEEEYDWITQYLENQKGVFAADIVDVFKVKREGESERLRTDLDNHQLLWHGSRVTNYVGILSQGLRIAPKEAPCSGYRFGKGIYFADLAEKSLHYCRGAGSDHILIMLVEAVLGKPKELMWDQYMEEPLPGFNSTKAMGKVAPDKTMKTPDGIVIPFGAPGKTGLSSGCEHNEYIVYNINQACIRYLIRVNLREAGAIKF